jgi:hypothetical protein
MSTMKRIRFFAPVNELKWYDFPLVVAVAVFTVFILIPFEILKLWCSSVD